MQFSFTPAAARKLLGLMAEKGEGLTLRIHIRRPLQTEKWSMTFETGTQPSQIVDGVPVVYDQTTEKFLDGMVIDWVQTPEGDGFGVYERNLRDMKVLPR